MSEVTITGKIVLNADGIASSVKRAQADLGKLGQYAKSLKIAAPAMETSTMAGKWRQTLDQLQETASHKLAGIRASIRPDTTELVKVVDDLKSKGIEIPVKLSPKGGSKGSGAKGAKGGDDDDEGGGGRGRGSFADRLTRRALGPAIIAREAMAVFQTYRQHGVDVALANNDPEAMVKAHQEFADKITNIPLLGQAADLITDPTGSRAIENKRQLRMAQSQRAIADAGITSSRETTSMQASAAIAGAGGAAREKLQADEDLRQAATKINDARDAETAKARSLAQDKIGSIRDRYGDKGEGDSIINRFYREAQAKEEADVNSTSDGETKRIEAEAEKKKQAADKIRNEKLADISRAERLADAESRHRVADTAGAAADAELRMQGQARAARDAEFVRNLNTEIELLQARARTTKDVAEQTRLMNEADAKSAAMGTLLKERKDTEDRAERLHAAQSRDRIGDMGLSADVSTLRASGATRAAEWMQQTHAIDDNIRKLKEDADAEDDIVKKRQLLAELAEAERLRPALVANLKRERDRSDESDIAEIREKTQDASLRTSGRFYEADLAQTEAYYKKRIKIESDNERYGVVEELRLEKSSIMAQREKAHQERIDDLNRDARETSMRADGYRQGADVEHIKRETNKALSDAVGDPTMRQAIRGKGEAELHAILKATQGRPEISNADAVWSRMQMSLLEDPKGDKARARKLAEDQLKRWRQQDLSDGILGGIAGGVGAGAAGAAGGKLIDAGKGLKDAADAITKAVSDKKLFVLP